MNYPNYSSYLVDRVYKGSQEEIDILLKSVFYERPVDFREFIMSPGYLNLSKIAYEPIVQIMERIWHPHIREGVIEAGRGSGKSFICSAHLAYSLYWLCNLRKPQLFYRMSPSATISVLNVSTSSQQSEQVIFGDLLQMVENCRFFKGKYKVTKRCILFPKSKVRAISGNSGSAVWRGYNIFASVTDEINFFRDSRQKSNSEEMWTVLEGSCQSRFPNDYKLIGVSSSLQEDDFTDRFRKTVVNGKRVFLPFQNNLIKKKYNPV